MIRQIIICFTMLTLFQTTDVFASALESLARQGYGVLETTIVIGEFNGCEFDKRIGLADRLIFVCSGYQYHYAYAPEVLILKHVNFGSIKVLIDGEEFSGSLYRSQ